MDLGSAVVGSVALGFPVLGSFYKLSQFSSHVKGVDEQTKDLLLTAYHIESNLKEARRLRTIKAALLDASERSWMDNVIRDTEYALLGVAKLVEPARIDLRIGKSVGFINRVDWVLRQSIKVAGKHTRLTTCHQSLVAAISSLNLKPVKPKIGTISEEYPSPHDPHMQRFLNFQNQRYRRRSIMSLRSEGTSAESGSLTSSPSTMTKATSDRNSGSSTTGSVNSSRSLLLPGSSSPLSSPIVPGFDSDADPSDVRDDSGAGSPEDYSNVPLFLETNTYASISFTQAADTERNTQAIRDGRDNIASTTISLPPPSFPGADGLQVYDPYSPYHLPPFLHPLYTCASTSSFIHHPLTSNAKPYNLCNASDPTEEIAGSSKGLDHSSHIQESQQQMQRNFGDSSNAPELHSITSTANLAVSEGARPATRAGREVAGRSKRSWLRLHASRVNIGHGIGWQGE